MSKACSSIQKNQRSGVTALDLLPSQATTWQQREGSLLLFQLIPLFMFHTTQIFTKNIRLNLITPSP